MQVIKVEHIDDTPEAILEWLQDAVDRLRHDAVDEHRDVFDRGYQTAIQQVLELLEMQRRTGQNDAYALAA